MANTVELLRLMRHAADLLSSSDPVEPLAKAVRSLTYTDDIRAAQKALGQATAARCFAEAVLRMVAAAMEDEPPRTAMNGQVLERGPGGRFRRVVTSPEVAE